ncbi:MAG: PEP-CTERM sorting domain-containing protein [Candidatus Nitricoxidivorans perseverans]|uniref:PEP-CTERM sorting domain-containing protein n=1 Tax=Candidatus Nitricoxidivorans perseverans TaxID=2975601 RepID=A0AA49J038_9PROT|nr:MAG: PEP-CTERM sorting domain-containing protein [Candidatus Nitricoxidivorans perseverans]
MKIKHAMTSLALGMTLAAGNAQAALHDWGGGLIYDDVLDVTWLSDANYAETSGYDADGKMTWAGATAWAAALSYTVGAVTYTDWRLPTALNTDGSGPCSGSCNDSEMGHLFYVDLGGSFGSPISTSVDPDLSKFQNIKDGVGTLSGGYYWSSTEYSVFPGLMAWNFDMGSGNQQDWSLKSNAYYAWAVRDGAPIPEPGEWALMLSGLGLVGFMARRRAARLA